MRIEVFEDLTSAKIVGLCTVVFGTESAPAEPPTPLGRSALDSAAYPPGPLNPAGGGDIPLLSAAPSHFSSHPIAPGLLVSKQLSL